MLKWLVLWRCLTSQTSLILDTTVPDFLWWRFFTMRRVETCRLTGSLTVSYNKKIDKCCSDWSSRHKLAANPLFVVVVVMSRVSFSSLCTNCCSATEERRLTDRDIHTQPETDLFTAGTVFSATGEQRLKCSSQDSFFIQSLEPHDKRPRILCQKVYKTNNDDGRTGALPHAGRNTTVVHTARRVRAVLLFLSAHTNMTLS